MLSGGAELTYSTICRLAGADFPTHAVPAAAAFPLCPQGNK